MRQAIQTKNRLCKELCVIHGGYGKDI